MQLERIGPYRIDGRLGAGGMGEVFRGHDERLDRPVAVKLLRRDLAEDAGGAERRERLRREARATARLSHPAVVQIYDVVEGEGFDGIVMELVEGETLWRLLRRGPLAIDRAVALGQDVAGALCAAHERGIVHRDLKAENVLVTPSGRAKVFDFGIARRLDEAAEPALTADGVVVGTCRAMAPEQVEGQPVDARSDLFSLGVLLYEAATGRSPFLAASAGATMHRVATHRQRPARERNRAVPDELSELIDRLLAKLPAERPASAAEVAGALARIAAGLAPSPEGTATRAEPTTVTARREVRPPTGERRQVTVLHGELVAPGGGALDAEELLAGLPALRVIAGEVVARWEGRLLPATGSGLQACFGIPRAQEDDARRAVHAALEIHERFAAQQPGAAVRLGLNTGPVVVARSAGPMGDELTAGETASLAGAAVSLAGPGAVLISSSTHRLIEGYFACQPLAPAHHPAAAHPLVLYRVGEPTGAVSRLERTDAVALSPLVAREEELELLLSRWRLVQEGKGQTVLLVGEAGLGKSRLLRELALRVAGDDPLRLECAGSPYHRDSPFHPVVELLRRLLDRERQAPAAERLARLEELLAGYGLPLAETVPLLAALLALPAGERWAPLPLSPEAKRRKTREAVVSLLFEMAERRPVLLVVEDLHWVDPSSLELLGELIEQAATARLFVLVACRPELASPWSPRSHLTQLTLSPLTRVQAGSLVACLTADQPLPRRAVEQIVDRTDGLPLAIEELTRMVVESGLAAAAEERPGVRGPAGSLPPLAIPGTLRDSLAARLDRLEEAREVAQLASALGREFSADLLHAVSPWDEEFLSAQLARLVGAELLYRRGLPPRVRYVFKHALIRDAAYDSLLRTQRRVFHERIARVLLDRFPEVARDQPELVAHHATEAGLTAEAVEGWQRAGQRSLAASAYREADGHLSRALALLADLPPGRERDAREVSLRIAYGVAAGVLRTYAAPDVRESYDRALALCEELGPTPQLFPVLRGAYAYHLMSGRPRIALGIAERLLRLGEESGQTLYRLSGRQSVGFALLMCGELASAREHQEAALADHDPETPATAAILPGVGDPAVVSLANLSWIFWLLGLTDLAAHRGAEAIDLAERRANPFAQAFARFSAGELTILRREPELAARQTEEHLVFVAEQGYENWAAVASAQHGWALAVLGKAEEGAAELIAALAAARRSGMRFGLPQHLALLAEVHLLRGDAPAGLAALDEAFAVAEAGGERLFAAEFWRLRGELLAAAGGPAEEVEACLREALAVARAQGAKMLELRAAASLCRQGFDAGSLLAPLLAPFPADTDLPELAAARALLAGTA